MNERRQARFNEFDAGERFNNMAKIKLQSTNPKRAGQKRVLAYVGEVQFDENGIIEVDEDKADLLVEMGARLIRVDSIKKDEEKIDDNGLSKLTVSDLQISCERAGYPEEEWKFLKKPQLVEYVLLQVEQGPDTD